MSDFRLIGSSATLEGLIDGIGKYFYSKSIDLIKVEDTSWIVSNSGTYLNGYRVIKKKNRYRFELKN